MMSEGRRLEAINRGIARLGPPFTAYDSVQISMKGQPYRSLDSSSVLIVCSRGSRLLLCLRHLAVSPECAPFSTCSKPLNAEKLHTLLNEFASTWKVEVPPSGREVAPSLDQQSPKRGVKFRASS